MTRALLLAACLSLLGLLLTACPPTRSTGGGGSSVEICDDGVDNDEDGDIDESVDSDGDGFYSCADDDPDCDDSDDDVHPGATEVCDDVDNDCDGEIDEGCEADDDDAGDDDDAVDPEVAYIVEIHPEPDSDDFFVSSDLWVEFDRPVDDAGLSLAGPDDEQVPGAVTSDTPGRVYFLDPTDPLEPGQSYVFTVAWSPSTNSPLQLEFTTSEHGLPLDDPEDLIDRTFSVDLSSGTWVEPPGVGPIIGSQMDGTVVLMTATDDSDLSAGYAHVLGVLGVEEGGDVWQDPCVETMAMTAGPDGEVGTSDDTPSEWLDPRIVTGPVDMTFTVQGMTTTVKDAYMETTFAPDLGDAQGGIYEGTIDTRPMAEELDPDGGPGAMCDLIWETVNVACEECGDPDPGEYCLSTRVENLVSEYEPGLLLEPVDCIDIIDQWEFSGDCDSEAMSFDADGDGTYELCPDW